MKILHIIDSGGLYGAEIVLLNLVSEQLKLGLSPVIASIGEKFIEEKPLETEALKKGFRLRKFRMIPGPNPAGAYSVLRYAKSEGFNILHSHGYKGNIFFGLMPGRFRKLPLISTLHGYTSTRGFTKMRLYELLDAVSLRFIDAVILVDKGMVNHKRLKNLTGLNYHIVNNGIPPLEDQERPLTHIDQTHLNPTILEFCKKSFTIGAIGRLSAEKGFNYLIDALKILASKKIKARLVILGEGGQRKYLEKRIVDSGIGTRVILPGYVTNAKKYLPYFNVFVLSSLTEGLPITVLEAMQAGIPIIATRVGGLSGVLENGKAGILVDSRRCNELADAISELIKNPKKGYEKVEAARCIVQKKYSCEQMARNYLRIYEKVLSKNLLSDFYR
jgi:glycosyltransferase involved in cell wall biosynthesis